MFHFDNFGMFKVSAAGVGGEDALVLCWSGGKWTGNQVENVNCDPVEKTIRFKVVAAPSIYALFNWN